MRRSPRSRTCYARPPPGPRRLWWKRLVWHYRWSALRTLGVSSSMPDTDLRVTYCETCCRDAKGVKEDDISAVGSISGLSVEAKQGGTDHEPRDLYLQEVGKGYSDSTLYGFNTTAAEYDSAREAWTALQEEPNTAVISANLAPARTNFDVGAQEPRIKLSGFYQEDAALPDDLYIRVKEPRSGRTRDLRVIGVLEDTTSSCAGNVMTSGRTLDAIARAPVPPQGYVFRLEDGVSAAATDEDLEKGFVRSELQAHDIGQAIRDSASANSILTYVLTGFMGLGLLR